MLADQVRNNVAAAIDTLRANKLRSGLTILGVVMGVSTVMAMAAIVQGIKQQIVSTIEIAGPTTFYVVKAFSQTPVDPKNPPAWIRVRPDLTAGEARLIKSLPEIGYASIWGQAQGRLEYKGVRTQNLIIFGADDGFPEIYGGDLIDGRWFTAAEMSSGAAVAVLEEDAARRVFGGETIIDKRVQIGGRPAQVIGLYQKASNIFEPPGQATGAVVPYLMLDQKFTLDKTNAVYIAVKPRAGVTTPDAQEAVTVAMREQRGLRPADRNSFDMITQDQILDTFNKITGVFFLVMIVLSSVGLMVGGIGVMAIMMVSVTSRTREIGVRKAMGATRREILLQFLVEAATLTGIGGIIGIAVGLTLGRAITAFMNIDTGVPIALTVIAVSVSVGIGIVFGMIPAQRAARLDPIEALRYE
ncbi:MAG: ABC transporter permease [Gemmatimonadaceae bacterium]